MPVEGSMLTILRGHARDYVEGMWRMLQVDTPDDYVLGPSVSYV